MRLPGRDLKELLGDVVPRDNAHQTLADRYVEREIGRRAGGPWRVLDLGCGTGGSVDAIPRARSESNGWGSTFQARPEAQFRTRTDARFETFDGVSMPFADGAFELVYCKQVLEHVRRPEPLLAEVRRVLAPGGWFAGSTSQLEAYHSLEPVELHAGRDRRAARAGRISVRSSCDRDRGFTLIALARGRRASLLSQVVGTRIAVQSCAERGADGPCAPTSTLNATKLLFCGQFAFLAQRDDELDVIASDQARAAPHDPDNLLDRLSRPSTWRPITGTSCAASTAARRAGSVSPAATSCRSEPAGIPAATCSRRLHSGCVAVDSEPERVAGVESGRADEAHVGYAGSLELPPASFDVVLYRLVLHHIAYQGPLAPCFAEAARTSRVPAARWSRSSRDSGIRSDSGSRSPTGRCRDHDPRHARRHPAIAATARAEARAAGLVPELHAVTFSWRRMPRRCSAALCAARRARLEAAGGPVRPHADADRAEDRGEPRVTVYRHPGAGAANSSPRRSTA